MFAHFTIHITLQIVPAFHQAWLDYMVGMFGKCNDPLIDSLNRIIEKDGKVDMEEKFCSVALDIIGRSVFNYEFGSVTNESPVIKAVYSALVEAEHRSMTPAPYWDLPFANQLVPRVSTKVGIPRVGQISGLTIAIFVV